MNSRSKRISRGSAKAQKNAEKKKEEFYHKRHRPTRTFCPKIFY